MKLLLTIIQDADAAKLQKALMEADFQSTKLASTGGFLREGNTTVIIGVEDDKVEAAKNIINGTCCERMKVFTPTPTLHEVTGVYGGQPMEVPVGGAIVFVVNVEEFLRF